ncbi:MAG: hypothetical protein QG673_601 [Pseudomonadota bacterium]|nr:hypothetical protein [Pseudomonadota bacterium]
MKKINISTALSIILRILLWIFGASIIFSLSCSNSGNSSNIPNTTTLSYNTDTTPVSSSVGVLITAEVAVIDTAESDSPAGSLLVTNGGNGAITMKSANATAGISNLAGCRSGSITLYPQESCTFTFNVTQDGGAGTITISYLQGAEQTGPATESTTQAINWYNSQNGALASMEYANPLTIHQSTDESVSITVINTGGYNLTNLSIPNPQVLGCTTTTATISYPISNSCKKANLNVGESCSYILTINDSSSATNQQILLGVTGQYTNQTTKTYSRSSIINYSTSDYTYVYATNFHSNNMSAYSASTTNGSLTALRGSPFSTGIEPAGFVATPDNKFMYVANNGSNTVSGFAVESSSGILTSISGSPFVAGSEPGNPVMTPNGKFLYVRNWVSHTITAYSINSTTGLLSTIGNYNTGVSAQIIAIDATGRFLYIILTNNTVLEYSINQTSGALSSIGSIATGNYPSDIIISPNNKSLYVSNSNSNNLSAYSINSKTGVLSAIGTYSAGNDPETLVITPNYKFLYLVNYSSGNISAFVIKSNGKLTSISGSPFGSGDGAIDADIDSNGKFMYVSNNSGNTVSAYTINQTTGALTSVGTYSCSGANNVLIDDVNGYLYVTNNNGITVFAINSSTGQLTPGSTATAGNFTNGLLILHDPVNIFK